MKYLPTHEEISQAYAQHLHRMELHLNPEEIHAEASLLMMRSAQHMEYRFYEAGSSPSFVQRYARIIVQSPRPIQDIEPQDILVATGEPGGALILTDPFRRIDDTHWIHSDGNAPSRSFFWPHAVDLARVVIRRGPNRFKLLEDAVSTWKTVAVKIADEQLEGFSRGMIQRAYHVKAVITDIGGVIALLRFDSRTRDEWDEACRATRVIMQGFGVTDVAFRAERIVPLPDVPKGRGTVLYLS